MYTKRVTSPCFTLAISKEIKSCMHLSSLHVLQSLKSTPQLTGVVLHVLHSSKLHGLFCLYEAFNGNLILFFAETPCNKDKKTFFYHFCNILNNIFKWKKVFPDPNMKESISHLPKYFVSILRILPKFNLPSPKYPIEGLPYCNYMWWILNVWSVNIFGIKIQYNDH